VNTDIFYNPNDSDIINAYRNPQYSA